VSLFTAFEPATPPARLKPEVIDPPIPPRVRVSHWPLPVIDSAIDDLERERGEQWDVVVPASVLSAARLLPPDELTGVADYILGQLKTLRTRIAEDNGNAN
jgi:hypothetical protein